MAWPERSGPRGARGALSSKARLGGHCCAYLELLRDAKRLHHALEARLRLVVIPVGHGSRLLDTCSRHPPHARLHLRHRAPPLCVRIVIQVGRSLDWARLVAPLTQVGHEALVGSKGDVEDEGARGSTVSGATWRARRRRCSAQRACSLPSSIGTCSRVAAEMGRTRLCPAALASSDSSCDCFPRTSPTSTLLRTTTCGCRREGGGKLQKWWRGRWRN